MRPEISDLSWYLVLHNLYYYIRPMMLQSVCSECDFHDKEILANAMRFILLTNLA